MKLFVILALVTAAMAAPQKVVQIVQSFVDNAGPNSYSFGWETSDGSRHEQMVELKNKGTDKEAIAVRGLNSWVGPDGVLRRFTYIADENGFQPISVDGPTGALNGGPSSVVASLLP